MAGIFIVLMIVASLGLITYSAIAGRTSRQECLKQRVTFTGGQVAALAGGGDVESSASKWVKEKAAPELAKLIKPKSDTDQTRLRVKLSNAGYRGEAPLMLFLASKIVLSAALLILVLAGLASSGQPSRNVFGLAAAAGGIGFLLPNLWLYLAAGARRERVTHSLPDCLDLMVICVEAGLGLDAAMHRVSQELGHVHPELAEEFALANLEVQMGLTRADALTSLAVRTGVSQVKSFSGLLIQAERFGTSIANALRIHADSLRSARRQAAEERAAKTSVKLLFPLIFFIFPAIFVVLAGPAALKLYQTLSGGALGGG